MILTDLKTRDRPLIPQTNDRNSSQIKQRSPIFSNTLNVQSDRNNSVNYGENC
ncbi:hypothetical protein [Pseudanabaena sp. ABRG5-3]|uniref:hypothetical protein n=1 Tax=Pseudanabaena sp. ABRG5-3 TaxID=685565 RepID=UPI0013A66CB6|nr:hypothetical protein [Pseudanabaena sp. ABRG5-3]